MSANSKSTIKNGSRPPIDRANEKGTTTSCNLADQAKNFPEWYHLNRYFHAMKYYQIVLKDKCCGDCLFFQEKDNILALGRCCLEPPVVTERFSSRPEVFTTDQACKGFIPRE